MDDDKNQNHDQQETQQKDYEGLNHTVNNIDNDENMNEPNDEKKGLEEENMIMNSQVWWFPM